MLFISTVSGLNVLADRCNYPNNFFINLWELASFQQTEWACPSCTFINKPSRPGCEICATARPDTHIQQVLHKYPTKYLFVLLSLTSSLSDSRLCFCLTFSHKGERTERGPRRVWLKQQQLTPHHRCLVAVSRSLAHTCTHTRSEDANSATHMLTKILTQRLKSALRVL